MDQNFTTDQMGEARSKVLKWNKPPSVALICVEQTFAFALGQLQRLHLRWLRFPSVHIVCVFATFQKNIYMRDRAGGTRK